MSATSLPVTKATRSGLLQKRFTVRPRAAGLWLRMTLTDGDELEGLAANDRSLIEGAGLLLTPPDTRSNTQRIYVPRTAIQTLEVVSLIGAGTREAPDQQPAEQRSRSCSQRKREYVRRRPSIAVRYNLIDETRRAGNPAWAQNCAATRSVEMTGVKGIEEAGPARSRLSPIPATRAWREQRRLRPCWLSRSFPRFRTPTLRIKNPYHAFSRALGMFYQPPAYPAGIHPPPSSIRPPRSAKVRTSALMSWSGPGVHIGRTPRCCPTWCSTPALRSADHFFAHAHAVVREGCVLGDHVTLENGAIVGADGFGFSKNENGEWEKIPQSGPVRLGDRVDVQANACIDRATVGATEIGDGTKIDNLVQVGHGSKVGENTLLCAQTGLAGSSVIGNNVILAGQTGIAGHCSRGRWRDPDGAVGCSHDVPAGKMISGSPGFDNRIWLRAVAIFQRLPELLKRLDRVEKKVAAHDGTQDRDDGASE